MKRRTISGALAVSALVALRAHADWPAPEGADLTLRGNQPNDPGYPGQWNLFSYIPAENVNRVSEYERQIGAGIHADRAWQRTIGDRRVIIAVLDSGATWREDDLVNKYYLNAGELPRPNVACGIAGGDPYDVNGDGTFNVQDYSTATGHDLPTPDRLPCDPSVSDVNANGFLDPQDLILLFSDGIDDDENGYIDDISGWDAFHNDNDPNDDTDFGHGRGEAKDSGAETNNGRGEAGVCPECAILMVRAGDSFVVDAAEFATGVYFAVDSGASVIQEALGSINNPAVGRAAIDYAVSQGVAVVASAADEDSFHHNMPGTNDHTIYVHANVFDAQDREQATTFLNFNNCTNYGAQLLLSTPGTGCSSEATGKTSGAVGLLYAAALAVDLDPLDPAGYVTDKFGARRLHPEEIKQLLLVTADDIYDPASAEDPTRYPTAVGWEQRFGYGRTNIRKAVDEVFALRIPPVVDVIEPDWFQVLYPERTPTVEIQGSIRYREDLFDSYDYVVEWAPGIEPVEGDFEEIASGAGETAQQVEVTLASWDISSLTVDLPPMPEPDVDVNRNLVTVRVRVTLHSADAGREGTRGEIRRAFHVVRDADLLEGFPIDFETGLEPSPKISDLDGDGRMEIIQADTAGWLHVLDAAGQERAGWPVGMNLLSAVDPAHPENHLASPAVESGGLDLDTRSSSSASPAIGDLDGSGGADLDVVAASLDGYVYAWTSQGLLLDGFPVSVDPQAGLVGTANDLVDVGIFASPVLEDLDGNGDLEIIVAAYDGYVYVWNHDGTSFAGFPVRLQDTGRPDAQKRRIVATPAAGDIDGDGLPEIVVGTTESYDNSARLYVVDGDGSLLPGWPIRQISTRILPLVGEGLPNSPCLADVDGDGDVEIALSPIGVPPSVFDADGRELGSVNNTDYGELSNVDDNPTISLVSNGTIGDLDNDGQPDLLWAGAGLSALKAFFGSGRREDFDHTLGAWTLTPTGGSYEYLPGFPQRVDDWQFFENPAVADIDGDDLPEVLNGSGGYYLRAWNYRGEQPAGWPKQTGQWLVASPAVGDLDGDGLLEVVIGSREGFLYAWRTRGRTDGRVDWASFHHDDWNTGNYEKALRFGVRQVGGDGGGCCSVAGRRGSIPFGAAALLVLGAVTRLRRARRRG